MKRLRYSAERASDGTNTTIMKCRMRHSVKCSIVAVLFLSTTVYASESKVEGRGYSSAPYDAGDDRKEGEGRMSGRGYNDNPFEVNVDGTDNIFSREDDCSPDPNGLFGSDQGVEQELDFYYQVETLPILASAEQVQDEILEQVETSVSKTLLPSLFLEECAVTERARKKALIPHRRLAEMLGLTTLPEDTVLEGVECQGELSNELNECFVVDGGMTLYSTSAVDPSFLDGLKGIIEQAMNSGDFNDLDPRLINVSYRKDLDTTLADAGTGPTTASSGGSNSLPPYVYAIMGVGAAIIIVGAVAAFNKRRKRNDEPEYGSFPDQAIPEDNVV